MEVSGTSRDSHRNLNFKDSDCFAWQASYIVALFCRSEGLVVQGDLTLGLRTQRSLICSPYVPQTPIRGPAYWNITNDPYVVVRKYMATGSLGGSAATNSRVVPWWQIDRRYYRLGGRLWYKSKWFLGKLTQKSLRNATRTKSFPYRF